MQPGSAAAAAAAAGGNRRYRLADFVPTGVVDMSVSLEDINDFMVCVCVWCALYGGCAGVLVMCG